MTSRSCKISAEFQNVCPVADSCTHLCSGTLPRLLRKTSHRDRVGIDNALMRAVVNPLYAVRVNRLAIAQPRFINGRCGGSLLLQPRVISRRRRHGRRRCPCRRHDGPAAESHKRSNGKA